MLRQDRSFVVRLEQPAVRTRKGPGVTPGPFPRSVVEPQSVNVCVKTVTPPCCTVIVALVKSMSVI
jgi:hypothetical protein